MANANPCGIVQVRMCMEALGRFDYHIISGQTGSGKGKLLDALRDQGAQVCCQEGPSLQKDLCLAAACRAACSQATQVCSTSQTHKCSTVIASIAALQRLPSEPAD